MIIIEKLQGVEELPTHIEKEIKQRSKEEFYDTFFYENDMYLVASLGQKNTAGYQVSIEKINSDIIEWEVMMQKEEPKKDQIVAQVITNPLSIVKVLVSGNKSFPKKVIFKNKMGEIIKGIKVQE